MKAIFTLTVFEILLFEGRLVLSPAQQITGSERVKDGLLSFKKTWHFFNVLWLCMMMMMMMMNYFYGMVDQRKAFSLISSLDHCQRSLTSRISDTLWAGFGPAQNLSSGLVFLLKKVNYPIFAFLLSLFSIKNSLKVVILSLIDENLCWIYDFTNRSHDFLFFIAFIR